MSNSIKSLIEFKMTENEYDYGLWEKLFPDMIDKVFNKELNKESYKIKDQLDFNIKEIITKAPLFEYLVNENTAADRKNDKTADEPTYGNKDVKTEHGMIKDIFSFLVIFNKYNEDSRRDIASLILGDDYKKDIEIKFSGIPAGQQGIGKTSLDKDSVDVLLLNKLAYRLIGLGDNSGKLKLSEEEQKLVEKLSPTYKNSFYLLAPSQYYPSDEPTKKLLSKMKMEEKALENDKPDDKFYTRGFSSIANELKNEVDNILKTYIDNNSEGKNIILTGIPGTGKTFAINEYLKAKGHENAFVQFHPSYDYEDFIEGFKPVSSKDGTIEFKLVNGIFKDLCKKAYENKISDNTTKTYVMVIDEINRANLSRVFGELLYCLEYRDEFVSTKMTTYIQSLEENEEYTFASNNKEDIGKFQVPSNVIVLGTMNEVDRSIDAFDLALRRRFIWEEIGFDKLKLEFYLLTESDIKKPDVEQVIERAKKLNDKLSKTIGNNYMIGHTYYFKIKEYEGSFKERMQNLWKYHLKSLLKEYCKIKFSENEIEKNLKEFEDIIVKTTKY